MYSFYNHSEQLPLDAYFYALNNSNSDCLSPVSAWGAGYAVNDSLFTSRTSSPTSSRQASGDSYCAKPTATSVAWTPRTALSPAEILYAEPEELASLSPMQMEQGDPDLARLERRPGLFAFASNPSSPQILPQFPDTNLEISNPVCDHKIHYISKDKFLASCTCGKQFKRKYAVNSLKRHIREKAKEAKKQLYHCRICDFANVRHCNLDQHYTTQHPLEPCSYCKYKCHICGKSFDSQDDLDRHVENKHRYQS